VENLTNALGALVTCGLLLVGVGWFIDQSWRDLNDRTQQQARGPGLRESAPTPRPTATGGGKPAAPLPVCGPTKVTPKPAVAGDSRAMLEQSLKLAREGSFTEAQRVAERALKQLPDESEGLCYIAAYAEQYSNLADQARLALNGSSEVDLGSPYGKAQFVDQTADDITFFSKGKHKKFSIKEFNSRKGVRFRITRDFLDNASNPANDLILGSYQFLMLVNDNGEKNGSGNVDAAEHRFRKAINSGDPVSAEQGTLMLKAVKLLTSKD